MHYYSFHPGDYTSHTLGLSVPEDLAYRRMLDLYYLKERPLKSDPKAVAKDIGMADYLEEITYILEEYFTINNGFCEHARCEKEIKSYQALIVKRTQAGRASGAARRKKGNEHMLNTCSTHDEHLLNTCPTNQEPVTIKVASDSSAIPFDDV